MSEARLLEKTELLISKYRIENFIHNDDRCNVYLSRHQFSNNEVILKQYRNVVVEEEKPPGERATLDREFEILKKLEHPAVPKAYDYFNIQDMEFLALQIRRGTHLRKVYENGMSMNAVQNIIGQILGALDEIHHDGIAYLGLSPDNVLVDEDGNISLLGFGMARNFDEAVHQEDLDAQADDFTAPEIKKGESASAKADVYSLGALLFFLLTGKSPVKAEITEELSKIDLGDEFKSALRRCLNADPKGRYRDVEAIRFHLFSENALKMPEVEKKETHRDFTNIGQLMGCFPNEDRDKNYKKKIIAVLFVFMIIAGILTPLLAQPLMSVAIGVFVVSLISIVVVTNNSFFSTEIGDLGFAIKGPGTEKIYPWSQVDKFTMRTKGFRVFVHLINGEKVQIKTEDTESLVHILEEVSGKLVIVESWRRKKFY